MIRRIFTVDVVGPGWATLRPRSPVLGRSEELHVKVTPQESAELVPGTNYRVDISSVPSGKEE